MMKIAKTAFVGWKVLVVEDDPDNLDVAFRILSHYGAEIVTATNGKEGLDSLKTFTPDFIISDLSMPVMDGWGFCYELQQDRSTAQIPIFALTAHAMLGDRERAIAAGFTNYLTKPLTPANFAQQLVVILTAIPAFQDRVDNFMAKA